MIAAQRARDIAAGGSLTLDRDNDKNPVVALREIADETVPLDGLRTALVQGLQKHVEVDEPRSEEHTSELQSLMRISYAVFCLKKKTNKNNINTNQQHKENDTA